MRVTVVFSLICRSSPIFNKLRPGFLLRKSRIHLDHASFGLVVMALFMSLPQRGKRTSHWASPSVLDLRYLLCPERAKLLCYVD